MSPSTAVELADAVSALMYTLAGWLLVGLGALGVVVPIAALVGGTVSGPIFPAIFATVSLCMVLLGLFVMPGFRRRLDRRRGLGVFGRSRAVDHRVLRAAEGRREHCVACGTRTREGEVRRYREAVYVAGLPLYTFVEGENVYCPDCATSDDTPATAAGTERARTAPVTES